RASGIAGAALLAFPLSGSTPTPSPPPNSPLPISWWRSGDGGAKWAHIVLPIASPESLGFTARFNASGYYALVQGASEKGARVAYYSDDGGANWRPMPGLNGAGQGYPNNIEARVITSDGVVLASTARVVSDQQQDTGIFTLRLGDLATGWKPYLPPG